jgi:hypothetical protein
MTRQDSRAEYAERMHRVLAHIEYCAPDARYEAASGRFGCDIVIPVIAL